MGNSKTRPLPEGLSRRQLLLTRKDGIEIFRHPDADEPLWDEFDILNGFVKEMTLQLRNGLPEDEIEVRMHERPVWMYDCIEAGDAFVPVDRMMVYLSLHNAFLAYDIELGNGETFGGKMRKMEDFTDLLNHLMRFSSVEEMRSVLSVTKTSLSRLRNGRPSRYATMGRFYLLKDLSAVKEMRIAFLSD